MAAIAITIQTSSAQILDPNGRNGWGTVTIRPSQAFVYTSAAVVYTVTNAAVVIGVADGIIATVAGSAATTFTLSPTTSNSNVPTEVYYIVDLDINGTQTRKYWVLDYQANTSVEWGSVALLPSTDTGTDSAVNNIINGTTNLAPYLKRSDTVDAATIGTASDGRGYVPRLNSSTGTLPVGFLPVSDVVSQTITNGVTTKAPSEDAVYDALALKQPLDSDLTTIAALTPTNDDFMQRKSGAWANRTVAQVGADLSSTLVKQTITNGVTTSAPSEDAVYDALAAKITTSNFGYDEVVVICAAGNVTATLTSNSTRRYFGFALVSVTAGSLYTDFANVHLYGSAGGGGFAEELRFVYSGAGATLTARAYYVA